MSPRMQAVYGQALELTEAERLELAALLLEPETEREPGYDEAWGAEIRRRIDEIEQGTAKTVPWEEVRRMLHDIADHGN